MSRCDCDHDPHRDACPAHPDNLVTTPEEQAAEVLAAHQYVPSGLRGVSRCACGIPFHGMPHDHRAHVATALAPLFAEERRKGAEGALREAATAFGHMWQADQVYAPVVYRALRERADTYAEGGERTCRHYWVPLPRRLHERAVSVVCKTCGEKRADDEERP